MVVLIINGYSLHGNLFKCIHGVISDFPQEILGRLLQLPCVFSLPTPLKLHLVESLQIELTSQEELVVVWASQLHTMHAYWQVQDTLEQYHPVQWMLSISK